MGGKNSKSKMKLPVDQMLWRFQDPVAGTNLSKDKIISFELETGPDEFISLPQLPFYITYQAKHGEAPYTAQSLLEADTLNNNDLVKLAYFPNTLGASCLFEQVEAHINGFKLNSISNLGKLQYLWAAMNRYFSTMDERVKMFGDDMAQIVDGDAKRNWTAPSEELLANCKSMQFFSDSAYKTSCFGFDGCSFLGPRCFANAKLQDKSLSTTPNVILPPNTNLVIKLHLTDKQCQRIEYPTKSYTYFSSTEETTDLTAVYKTKVLIQSLKLVYKSYKLSGPTLTKFSNASYSFRHEAINYQQFSVPPGTKYTPFKVLIPERTKLVFICFVRSWQIYPFSSDNKAQYARFCFPKHLMSVTCTLPGKSDVGFEKGYESLNESYNSSAPKAYYQSLLESRVIDCSYDSLFPEAKFAEGEISYRQAIMLDFTQNKINSETTMNLGVVWDTSLTPTQNDTKHDHELSALVFTVQDAELYREKKSEKYLMRVI